MYIYAIIHKNISNNVENKIPQQMELYKDFKSEKENIWTSKMHSVLDNPGSNVSLTFFSHFVDYADSISWKYPWLPIITAFNHVEI